LIIAQRLVRKLCPECKEPFEPPEGMLTQFGLAGEDTVYYKAVGCAKCNGSGYTGRMAVHEFLPMTKTVREMVARKAPEHEVQQVLRQQGMRFLSDRGIEKVREGSTTINEIYRVLQLEDEEKVLMANRCPHCKASIEPDFAVCPNCLASLKKLCQRCNQQLKMDWKICPYCKTAVTAEPEAGAPVALLMGGSTPADAEPVAAAAAAEKKAAVAVAAAVHGEAGREAESALSPADGDGQSEAPSAKKPRILVVDDDASIRTIVTKSLEQLPFPVEIQSASNGVEGFEMVRSIRPDMVVLDIMMPGMDGFEVCQKLRSQVETAFIPVIMLTANPSEEGRIKGYLAGTDDYLAKPFNVAELHARVSRLLRRAYGIS